MNEKVLHSFILRIYIASLEEPTQNRSKSHHDSRKKT